jgi:site-specific DNA-cytosine methylase
MLQVPRGDNPGYMKEQEVCPTLSGSAWQHNNFIEDDPIMVNTQPRSPDRPSLKNGTSVGGSGVIWEEDGTTYCLDTVNAQADGLSKKEIMNTLTTELAHSTGRDFYRTSGEKILKSCGVFRRLTPKECFRLQGFLDIDINLNGLSDTQIYKLAGNGQSLNVVTKLFEKMLNG